MSDPNDGKRTSLTYTKLAHARITAMSKELKMTQPEIINLLLEKISIDVIRPFAAEIVKQREAEKARKKKLMDKLANADPAKIEKLMEQL